MMADRSTAYRDVVEESTDPSEDGSGLIRLTSETHKFSRGNMSAKHPCYRITAAPIA